MRTSLLHKRLPSNRYWRSEAAWRSGYAADCKSVYSGSIPDAASILKLVSLLPSHRIFFSGAVEPTAFRHVVAVSERD
jgi:hypothetical protein